MAWVSSGLFPMSLFHLLESVDLCTSPVWVVVSPSLFLLSFGNKVTQSLDVCRNPTGPKVLPVSLLRLSFCSVRAVPAPSSSCPASLQVVLHCDVGMVPGTGLPAQWYRSVLSSDLSFFAGIFLCPTFDRSASYFCF